MRAKIAGMVVGFAIAAAALAAHADELDAGKQMVAAGNLQGAAEFFNRYALSHPDDSRVTPEALALCGRILDTLSDSLTGQAEKSCYWGKGGSRSPECMEQFVRQFNARFGEGAFAYEHTVVSILYTGLHYRMLASRFPQSSYAGEANFYLLLKGLVGHPDAVLPRVKAYLEKYPRGEWHRRGLLLWARVNEDIWHVHRKWSWMLYNGQLSQDELIIRAEPYRQEALKTHEKLMKEPGSSEGAAAAREHATLKAQQEDGNTYSIVSDAMPGTLAAWGVDQPKPPPAPPDPGAGFGAGKRSAAPAAPPPEATKPPIMDPAVPPPPEEEPKAAEKKKGKPPQRWQ